MIDASKKNKTDLLLVAALCVVCFVVHLAYLDQMKLIILTSDELGYFGNAAYMAGLDWTALTRHVPYYSYGYSLLLAPLFSMFPANPTALYQGALVINCILMSGAFLLAYGTAQSLFPKVSAKLLALCAFAAVVMPSILLQSGIAWSECTLMFVMWALLFVSTKIRRNASPLVFVLFGALLLFGYMIHQRTLGVIAAGGIMMLVQLLRKQITLRQFLLFVAVCAGLFALHTLLKDYFKDALYQNSTSVQATDFEGVGARYSLIFTAEGFKQFLREVVGQLFYLGAASMLFYFVVGFALLRKLFPRLRLLHAKKADLPAAPDEHRHGFYLFLALAALFTFLISALFMIEAGRLDQVIYGRYNEIFLGALTMLGLLALLQSKKRFPLAPLALAAIFVLLGILTERFIQPFANMGFQPLTVGGVAWHYPLFFTKWWAVVLCPLLVFFAFYLLCALRRKLVYFISIVGLSAFFVCSGLHLVRTQVLPLQRDFYAAATDAVQHIDPAQPVYYYYGADRYSNIALVQFLLPETQMAGISTTQELSALPLGATILSPRSELLNEALLRNATLNGANARFLFWTRQDQSEASLYQPFSLPLTVFSSQNAVQHDAQKIVSNGSLGYLLYGPYLSLPAGAYTITVSLQTLDAPAGVVGSFDIATANGNQNLLEITDRDTAVSTTVVFAQDVTNLEIRVVSRDGVVMEIDQVTIQRNATS